jgi:hypothetical protein
MAAAVDRLPGPYWAPYVVAWLAYQGLVAAARWRDGQPMTLEVVFSNSLPFYGFWLIHHLNRRAAASLSAFRPAFTGNEVELQEAHWQLTTLPAWPAAAASLVALLLGITSSLSWGWASAYQVLSTLAYYATVVFAGLYAYHALRQLRLVTSLFAGRTLVDIHNAAPLYSFAVLSAHTAIGMLLILSGAVLISAATLTGWWLVGSLAFAVLAVLTFLLPLTGLHRRFNISLLLFHVVFASLDGLVERGPGFFGLLNNLILSPVGIALDRAAGLRSGPRRQQDAGNGPHDGASQKGEGGV